MYNSMDPLGLKHNIFSILVKFQPLKYVVLCSQFILLRVSLFYDCNFPICTVSEKLVSEFDPHGSAEIFEAVERFPRLELFAVDDLSRHASRLLGST